MQNELNWERSHDSGSRRLRDDLPLGTLFIIRPEFVLARHDYPSRADSLCRSTSYHQHSLTLRCRTCWFRRDDDLKDNGTQCIRRIINDSGQLVRPA